MVSNRSPILLAALAAFMLLSCARSFNPDVERGSNFKYKEGYPEARLSAIGFLDENDRPHINVAADIVYGSLIYKKREDKYVSNLTIEVQILDKDSNGEATSTMQFPLTVTKENANIVHSQDVFTFEKRVPVDPGSYEVDVTVLDQQSRKRITRTTSTFIPDPENKVLNLTNIQMLGKNVNDKNKWLPVTTYDLPGRIDSVKFIFQVTNNRSENPLSIDAKLIKYKSDTTVAWPMHYSNYLPSSIQYKGIDYDESKIIQSTRRVLTQPGSVLIEYKFGKLDRGNYRFEVNTSEVEENTLFKARDFGIKSRNYPSVKSPRELARPLVYIMGEGEYEELMAIDDPDSLKEAVDRFWLRHIGNKSKAKSTIRMYYERVEEANKQFSTFKEGWKTDPGMMYVLVGPPWFVDQFQNQMQWSYSYDHYTSGLNFLFKRSRLRTEYFPFNNYILQRSGSYFNLQYQQIQMWLTGDIITSRI